MAAVCTLTSTVTRTFDEIPSAILPVVLPIHDKLDIVLAGGKLGGAYVF